MIEGLFGSGPASRIAPKLWQGGWPKYPQLLSEQGFDMIVLCAREMQPSNIENARTVFPGMEIVLAPLDDSHDGGPSDEEQVIAAKAAVQVVKALNDRKRVLTTCIQGRNRSGLVNALALVGFLGVDGKMAVKLVQAARPNALTNRGFVKFLNKVKKW